MNQDFFRNFILNKSISFNIVFFFPSFLDENENGIEAYFLNSNLQIVVTGQKGSADLKFPFSFQEKCWYYICVSHSKSILNKNIPSYNFFFF